MMRMRLWGPSPTAAADVLREARIATKAPTMKDFWCREDIRSPFVRARQLAQILGSESRGIGSLFFQKSRCCSANHDGGPSRNPPSYRRKQLAEVARKKG